MMGIQIFIGAMAKRQILSIRYSDVSVNTFFSRTNSLTGFQVGLIILGYGKDTACPRPNWIIKYSTNLAQFINQKTLILDIFIQKYLEHKPMIIQK